MSGGGGHSLSKSDSNSKSNQDVWGPQGDALGDLYNRASSLMDSMGIDSSMLQQLAPQLSEMARGAYGSAQGAQDYMLGGGAVGNVDDIRSQLMSSLSNSANSPSNTSSMYQSIVGGAGNTYIDPMVEAMKSGAMDNLERMQSGGDLNAAAAGQGGGSRHAMQNAMMGAEANKDMMAQEANMRGGAYDKDLAMKMNIAGLADQNVAGAQDKMMSLLGMSDSNVGSGFDMSSILNNLGMGMMAPYMQSQQSQMNPMTQYSNIIGGPSILGSSFGNSESKGNAGHGEGGMSGGSK